MPLSWAGKIIFHFAVAHCVFCPVSPSKMCACLFFVCIIKSASPKVSGASFFSSFFCACFLLHARVFSISSSSFFVVALVCFSLFSRLFFFPFFPFFFWVFGLRVQSPLLMTCIVIQTTRENHKQATRTSNRLLFASLCLLVLSCCSFSPLHLLPLVPVSLAPVSPLPPPFFPHLYSLASRCQSPQPAASSSQNCTPCS